MHLNIATRVFEAFSVASSRDDLVDAKQAAGRFGSSLESMAKGFGWKPRTNDFVHLPVFVDTGRWHACPMLRSQGQERVQSINARVLGQR